MVIERLKQDRGFWTLKSDRITDGERGWMDAVAIGTKKYHSWPTHVYDQHLQTK